MYFERATKKVTATCQCVSLSLLIRLTEKFRLFCDTRRVSEMYAYIYIYNVNNKLFSFYEVYQFRLDDDLFEPSFAFDMLLS